MMAAIPLAYAVPLQIGSFFGLISASWKECQMGDGCAKTDYMYWLYSKTASKIAFFLPITVPLDDDFSVDLDCMVVMNFVKVRCSASVAVLNANESFEYLFQQLFTI